MKNINNNFINNNNLDLNRIKSFRNNNQQIDSTFKKICILQSKLKDLMSKKMIFENTKNQMIKKLNENTKKYFLKKIKIKEIYNLVNVKSFNEHNNYNLLSEEDEDLLISKSEAIKEIFFLIRKEFKLLLFIIEKLDKQHYENFSYFISHFLYEKIINENLYQEELNHLIYLLLEKLIYNLPNKNFYNFLNSHFIYHILLNLTRKENIKNYLVLLLEKNIIKLDNSINNILTPNLNILYSDYIQESNKSNKNNAKKNKILIKEFFSCNNLNTNEENVKLDDLILYPMLIQLNINKEILIKELEKYKNKENNLLNNINIYYLNNQINLIEEKENNKEIFSNIPYMIKLKKFQNFTNIEEVFQNLVKNINVIRDTTIEILTNILNNIDNIPYTIKTILKIIEILIEKKFKNTINEYEKIMFLANFYFECIIIPIIKNPNYNGIITTQVVSEELKSNLIPIVTIFNQLIKGYLFNNNNINEIEYSIFNYYILTKIKDIFFEICLKLKENIKIDFQTSIENLINNYNQNERDLNYDYFKFHNDENINHQCLCLSYDEIICINELIILEQNYIKSNYNSYNKYFKIFFENKLRFIEKYKNEIKNKKINYIYFTNITYNNNFDKQLNNLENDKFIELNENKIDDSTIFKKCLCEVLIYLSDIHISNFNIINSIDLKKTKIIRKRNFNFFKKEEFIEKEEDFDFNSVILPKILDNLKIEIGYNLNNKTNKKIIFCATFLELNINNLKNIYKFNNYKLLFEELINQTQQIINNYNQNFIITQFYYKIKTSEKMNLIENINLNQLKKIQNYSCVNLLFENLEFPIIIRKHKINNNLLDKLIIEKANINENNNYCKNLSEFIEKFPDLRCIEVPDNNVFKYQEDLKVNIQMNNIFKELKSYIKSKKILSNFTKEEINLIEIELENFIYLKLYLKLVPIKPSKLDVKIYNKCLRLNSLKPENCFKEKNYYNEILCKNAMVLINSLNNFRTPIEKINCFKNAIEIIENSITFNSGKESLGIDDSIELITYVFMKSQPKMFFTNFSYSYLYLNKELSKKSQGQTLGKMDLIMKILIEKKRKDFINVSEEMFGNENDDLKNYK